MTSRSLDSTLNGAAEEQSAAFFHPATREARAGSIGALWHLLSLDAPTVAVLWTIFIAALTQTWLPLALSVAILFAVWALYASDRLLDARPLAAGGEPALLCELEPRHHFHHLHRRAFTKLVVFCVVGAVALLPSFPQRAARLYLFEGVAMAGYFLLVHAPQSFPNSRVSLLVRAHRLPKELLVGPFFSAATFIPTVSARPELRPALLPLALLFAALCSLNCIYIHAWEHPASPDHSQILGHLKNNLAALSLSFLAGSLLCLFLTSRADRLISLLPLYPLACMGSALALVALHATREKFSPVALRASADAALLSPLVLLPIVHLCHL